MKKNYRVHYKVLIAIVAAITIIEVTALINGFDGKLLTLALTILAGLGGWIIPVPKIKGG